MTHDKQKLEYLLSQLKADNTGRYRVITNAGNIEDWCLLSLVEDYKNLDLDATAVANGIQWPTELTLAFEKIKRDLASIPDKPRMFTEQEVYEYHVWRNKILGEKIMHDSELTVDAWLKSKEEKLMLGDAEIEIVDGQIISEDWTLSFVTPEQLIKLTEKLKSLQS